MCPVHPEKSIFFYDISTTYSVGYMLFLMGKTGFDHSQYFIELSLSYFFLSSVRRDVAIRTEASISVCPVIKTVTVIYYTVSYSSMIFCVFVNLMINYDCHYYYHTHPFNGPFSGTTRVSQYQKGKTNLHFTEARDSEWQWHQLGHMQVCISIQTDSHASTPPLSFLQARCPSCRPTNSVKALKAEVIIITIVI